MVEKPSSRQEKSELRKIILHLMDSKFLKIAIITHRVYNKTAKKYTEEEIHQEILIMRDDGLIDYQGNVEDMRMGEIRKQVD